MNPFSLKWFQDVTDINLQGLIDGKSMEEDWEKKEKGMSRVAYNVS